MTATAHPLLRAEGVGRRLADRWIWRDISLELPAGKCAVLSGSTGSGKSLLMRALCGLDAVDEGTVELLGRPLDAWAPPEARATALWLAQRPLICRGTVWDNVRLPAAFAAQAARVITRERAVEALAPLARDERFLDADADTLSGGEEQIVGLVRALLLEPRVLLLDEPTAHLDAGTSHGVEQLISEWIDGWNPGRVLTGDAALPERALLWTSHDAEQVDRLVRRFDAPVIRLDRDPVVALEGGG